MNTGPAISPMAHQETKKPLSSCGLRSLFSIIFRRRSSRTHLARRSVSTSSLIVSTAPTPAFRHTGSDKLLSSMSAFSQMPAKKKVELPVPTQGKEKRVQGYGLMSELDSMIHDHQRTAGSSTLLRASSGNVMLYGNLGNIRQKRPKVTLDIEEPEPEEPVEKAVEGLDAEEFKKKANEAYKNAKYEEALALYDRAISMNPNVASYYGSKAAALIGMGRLLEAVGECKQALKIDPSYSKVHHQVATLYLRLGRAERAIHHYQRGEAKPEEISHAHTLEDYLNRCSEARKLKDWVTLLEEANSAINAGADAAPQVFLNKAEALLMMHKHEEADSALFNAPKFAMDACKKFFGASTTAYVLTVQAQVNMSAGRFDNAVTMAEMAIQLDPGNKDVSAVAEKARAVAAARTKGNELFKNNRYKEACIAYGEGLELDSHNAILLGNRAVCRSKLGQWKKAIADCNVALNTRPSYKKARLRRADCSAKLERWKESIEDYEILLREMPGDEDITDALIEAKAKLKKQLTEGFKDIKCCRNLIRIPTEDRFRSITMSSGTSVGFFFSKSSEVSKQGIAFMEKLSKQYHSINFLLVDVKETPSLAKLEGLKPIPSFKVYKNGVSVKDISGFDHEHLESTLKSYSA